MPAYTRMVITTKSPCCSLRNCHNTFSFFLLKWFNWIRLHDFLRFFPTVPHSYSLSPPSLILACSKVKATIHLPMLWKPNQLPRINETKDFANGFSTTTLLVQHNCLLNHILIPTDKSISPNPNQRSSTLKKMVITRENHNWIQCRDQ